MSKGPIFAYGTNYELKNEEHPPIVQCFNEIISSIISLITKYIKNGCINETDTPLDLVIPNLIANIIFNLCRLTGLKDHDELIAFCLENLIMAGKTLTMIPPFPERTIQ